MIDLGRELAGYAGEPPAPARRRDPRIFSSEPDRDLEPVPLGDFVADQRLWGTLQAVGDDDMPSLSALTGPPGPPPWSLDTYSIMAAGVAPPNLCWDQDGVHYFDATGQRVDVKIPDRCTQCQRHLPTVTIRTSSRGVEPILCDECYGMRRR